MQVQFNISHAHGHWKKRERYEPHPFFENLSVDVIFDYAKCTSACVVRMLTGKGCGGGQTNASEVQEAVDHILSDFFFVGIVEEWNQSMSTFASLTGNHKISQLSANSRPGPQSATRQQVEGKFEKYLYEDDHVYRAALSRFAKAKENVVKVKLRWLEGAGQEWTVR
jgi:hypothetical protein